MTAMLKELLRMLVEERSQRETEMARREKEVQTHDNNAPAYGSALASSE